MSVMLLTGHHLEFLSLERGSSDSTLVKKTTLLEITCTGSFIKQSHVQLHLPNDHCHPLQDHILKIKIIEP